MMMRAGRFLGAVVDELAAEVRRQFLSLAHFRLIFRRQRGIDRLLVGIDPRRRPRRTDVGRRQRRKLAATDRGVTPRHVAVRRRFCPLGIDEAWGRGHVAFRPRRIREAGACIRNHDDGSFDVINVRHDLIRRRRRPEERCDRHTGILAHPRVPASKQARSQARHKRWQSAGTSRTPPRTETKSSRICLR